MLSRALHALIPAKETAFKELTSKANLCVPAGELSTEPASTIS